jgi:hypothetical protein
MADLRFCENHGTNCWFGTAHRNPVRGGRTCTVYFLSTPKCASGIAATAPVAGRAAIFRNAYASIDEAPLW